MILEAIAVPKFSTQLVLLRSVFCTHILFSNSALKNLSEVHCHVMELVVFMFRFFVLNVKRTYLRVCSDFLVSDVVSTSANHNILAFQFNSTLLLNNYD